MAVCDGERVASRYLYRLVHIRSRPRDTRDEVIDRDAFCPDEVTMLAHELSSAGLLPATSQSHDGLHEQSRLLSLSVLQGSADTFVAARRPAHVLHGLTKSREELVTGLDELRGELSGPSQLGLKAETEGNKIRGNREAQPRAQIGGPVALDRPEGSDPRSCERQQGLSGIGQIAPFVDRHDVMAEPQGFTGDVRPSLCSAVLSNRRVVQQGRDQGHGDDGCEREPWLIHGRTLSLGALGSTTVC